MSGDPSGASQQGYITNQNGYTAKEVAQLQAKTALSTALAAELLSPSWTDGFRDLRPNWDGKWALLSVNVDRGNVALGRP
ncbi:hypothetical protein FOXB_15481 [Fusarium oxysporum f. sp. conglutinans Fo5176]|uniref:Uncharacterized protein n=1 Tax=Fusarium oxysporum (strain Fo5176) TaxID=660025 RepID=F9G9Z9_FUSOF|nr:hypothetical protein FOXB_15481 [Fusarium oxysporum f. sp. conglutinans Fo5176]